MANKANLATITEVIQIMGNLGYKNEHTARRRLGYAIADGTVPSTRVRRNARWGYLVDMSDVEAWVHSRLERFASMRRRREKGLQMFDAGRTKRQIAEAFGVTVHCVIYWLDERKRKAGVQ